MPDAEADDIAAQADAIEAELRRIGWWQDTPPEPERMAFTQAFGMDTLAFPEWLQWVFLPRVREAVETGSFPPSSSVGVHAVREFDGVDEADDLISLLIRFDDLF